ASRFLFGGASLFLFPETSPAEPWTVPYRFSLRVPLRGFVSYSFDKQDLQTALPVPASLLGKFKKRSFRQPRPGQGGIRSDIGSSEQVREVKERGGTMTRQSSTSARLYSGFEPLPGYRLLRP